MKWSGNSCRSERAECKLSEFVASQTTSIIPIVDYNTAGEQPVTLDPNYI